LIQATFHPKVLSSVCFFGTDIHSATLGKGKNDDTLIKIRNGELAGKEVVVRHFIVSISVILIVIYVDDLWETGTQSLLQALHLVSRISIHRTLTFLDKVGTSFGRPSRMLE
jgi:hypothetical protein